LLLGAEIVQRDKRAAAPIVAQPQHVGRAGVQD
jgi:hypothetical protein